MGLPDTLNDRSLQQQQQHIPGPGKKENPFISGSSFPGCRVLSALIKIVLLLGPVLLSAPFPYFVVTCRAGAKNGWCCNTLQFAGSEGKDKRGGKTKGPGPTLSSPFGWCKVNRGKLSFMTFCTQSPHTSCHAARPAGAWKQRRFSAARAGCVHACPTRAPADNRRIEKCPDGKSTLEENTHKR